MSITCPIPVLIYPFLKSCILIFKSPQNKGPLPIYTPKPMAHPLNPNLLSDDLPFRLQRFSLTPSVLQHFSSFPSPISSSPTSYSQSLTLSTPECPPLQPLTLSILESQPLVLSPLPSTTRELWLDLRFFQSAGGCSLVSRRQSTSATSQHRKAANNS